MTNAHRRFLTADDLQRLLGRAGVGSPLTGHELLAGGTYNSVYRLGFDDRPGLILKLSPDPSGAIMTYERGIVAAEAQFYGTAGERTGLPVPQVIALLELGSELGGGEALLVTELAGVPWSGSGHPARGPLRAELGRLVAAMHQVTGPAFGYPSESTGPLAGTWAEAFTAMMDAVLDDAQRYGAVLPVDPQRVRQALLAGAVDLADVAEPVLVHFDLWDGNVLIDLTDRPRISGIIDGERALWGDPVMDFASLALLREIRDDADFIRGYQESGAVLALDPSARRRLLLYRVYLGLIMTVEPIPRGYGQSESELGALVNQQLVADLAELLTRPAEQE